MSASRPADAEACASGCSGHGTCSAVGLCHCEASYAGRDCGFFLGTSAQEERHELYLASDFASACLGGCSGRGRCVNGICACQSGFFGPACADAQCPNDCSGHGECKRGSCLCGADWMGRQCEMRASGTQNNTLLSVIPANEVRDDSAVNSEASQLQASPSSPVASSLHSDPDPNLEKIQRDAFAASDVADQLYAVALRESKRDAHRRIERAIAGARDNWNALPGHEFMPKPSAASSVGLLSQSRDSKRIASAVLGSKACSSGCNGHGTCNAAGECQCQGPWVGTLCDVPKCPEDCMGRGMCVAGACVCGKGHFGSVCQHTRCPGDCSGHGFCFSGRCECSDDFGGEACLTQVHSSNVIRFKLAHKRPKAKGSPELSSSSIRASDSPQLGPASAVSKLQTASSQKSTCPKECSERGDCVNGRCLCYAGFHGGDCSKIGACSGHGMMTIPSARPSASLIDAHSETSTCSCDPGWSGENCDVELICPDQSCAGHGVCTFGKCVCAAGYSGHSCHIALMTNDVAKRSQTRLGEQANRTATKSTALLSSRRVSVPASSGSLENSGASSSKTGVPRDPLDTPMTASWTWVRSAPKAEVASQSSRVLPASLADAKQATESAPSDSIWHDPATQSLAVSFQPRTEHPSITALLSTGATRRAMPDAAWTEHALESPTLPPLVAAGKEMPAAHDGGADIDAMLAGVSLLQQECRIL